MALLETLQDDFSVPATSTTIWTSTGTVAYTVGRARLTGGSPTPALASTALYDFGGAFATHLSAKVTLAGGITTGAEMRVYDTTSNARASIVLTTSVLNGVVATPAGGTTTVPLGSYDPVAMAYWRIRTAGGTVFWGYSADGTTWTEPGSTADTFSSTTVKARFSLSSTLSSLNVSVDDVNPAVIPTIAPSSIADPETIGDPAVSSWLTTVPAGIVDTETLGGPSAGGAVPLIETLQDAFTVGPLNARWTPTTASGATVSVSGSTLVISASTSASTATVTSTSSYAFTGSYLLAQVTPATSNAFGVMLRLRDAATAELFYMRRASLTSLTIRGNDGTSNFVSANPTYDAVAHAWWRIRHTAGTLYFETAPDGIAWTIQAQAVYAPKTTVYYAELFANWNATPTGSVVRFDNVNLAPYVATTSPATLGDPETPGSPAVSSWLIAVPTGITDPETPGSPAISEGQETTPDGITDPETLGEPALTFPVAATVTPGGITDPDSIGEPALSVPGAATVEPDAIIDPEVIDDPELVTDFLPGVFPDGIADPETLGVPETLTEYGPSNWDYGAGTYTDGPYYGAVPVDDRTDNPTYGTGTYGYGIYYGRSIPVVGGDPLFGDVAAMQPPLHILGIGPWSPKIVWRGLPNYGIGKGNLPARPALALPPATSKSFTLRLNEGSEARTEIAMRRGQAVIIDEMDTDLWWRRKDPRTRKLEVIGRFNCSHAELATTDTGVNLSAQYDSYETILSARMILRYLHPEAIPPTTMWPIGTPIIDILAWALPVNTGIDLSEVTGDKPYDLGKTTYVYHLPPGTLIGDVMSNLNAASPITWEWWIETPADVNLAPKLRFVLGTRGLDKGVALFDAGSGPTPIASWTRNGAADNYANSLYFTGGGTGTGADAGGGVVEQIPAQIEQYGQRDAQDGNMSLGGNIIQIRAGAARKLTRLADRKPTYTINLAQGFWRGREHIDVGDTLRLILRLGKEVIDTKYRVTEITVSIDENGLETVALTLGIPPASADPRSKRSPIMRIIRTLKNYNPPPGAIDIPPIDE